MAEILTPRGAFPAYMPASAPLAMPAQDLRAGTLAALATPPAIRRRRIALFGLWLLLSAAGAAVMGRLLASEGLTPLEGAAAALFVVLFSWTVFGFLSAMAGFLALWRSGPEPADTAPKVTRRTALLAPTYNEDPGRILAAIQAMYEDLQGHGVAHLYDVFVLSDTRDDAIAREEAAGVLRLRARFDGRAGIYYRRRARNTDRKAGNIADWVTRFGATYPFMLILDADSLMSGATLIGLTAGMEADPELGLLQSAPAIVNADTPFARLQQFASRAYGPMMAVGQHWWSWSDGNYWGHNAIIRTGAFAAHAGLPHLPGPRPLGGHILSHDFVEAALLRRAGWKVRMAPALEGSYEETPPTLVTMAVRDRRWCQGNIQHMGVLGAAGLHPISRLHLARGILSYLTSPLWLMLLMTGAGVWLQGGAGGLKVSGQAAVWLFGLTMAMLVTPKLLAGLVAMRAASQRQAFGGAARFWTSVVVEIVLSALIAPVLMLMQSVAVAGVLIGRDSGWATQQRDPDRLSRKEAWQAHGGHVLIGALAAACALLLDPALFWWASPVSLGLILSAPLSLVLAQPRLGRLLGKAGLFATPEARQPPPVVRRAAELRAAYDAEKPVRWQVELMLRKAAPLYEMKGARLAKPQPEPAWARPAA